MNHVSRSIIVIELIKKIVNRAFYPYPIGRPAHLKHAGEGTTMECLNNDPKCGKKEPVEPGHEGHAHQRTYFCSEECWSLHLEEEPQTMGCYMCLPLEDRLVLKDGFATFNPCAPERVVVSSFVTDRADPTEAYKLSCGHVII